MKNSELFRKTAKALIDKMPKGTQVRIADQLGISRPYMNDFLNGRKMLSESKREEIAEKLGYSYIDFLILGRNMFDEKPDNKIFQMNEKDNDFDSSDDYINYIKALAHTIEIFEESITTMFEPEILRLSAKIKAKAILNIHKSIMKKFNHRKIKLFDMDVEVLVKSLELFDYDVELYQNTYTELGCKSAIELKSRLIACGCLDPMVINKAPCDIKNEKIIYIGEYLKQSVFFKRAA